MENKMKVWVVLKSVVDCFDHRRTTYLSIEVETTESAIKKAKSSNKWRDIVMVAVDKLTNQELVVGSSVADGGAIPFQSLANARGYHLYGMKRKRISDICSTNSGIIFFEVYQ